MKDLSPTAGQIEVRTSKHVIYSGGITSALVGPLPTVVCTAQHVAGRPQHFRPSIFNLIRDDTPAKQPFLTLTPSTPL